ncbi:hypothetical protein [Mariniluteicoccus flavus]
MSARRTTVDTRGDRRPERTRPDVVGLVMGSIFTCFAAASLFVAFGGTLRGDWLKVALPVFLVAVGGAGLVLSRGRDQT